MSGCPCASCRGIGPEHEEEQSRRNTSPATRAAPDPRTNAEFWAAVACSPINRKEREDASQ